MGRQEKLKRILIWAAGGLGAAIVLGGAVLAASPSLRLAVWNNSAVSLGIGFYNRVRPSINFGNNPDCLAGLAAADLDFTPVPDHVDGPGCAVAHAVRVSRVGGIALDPPAVLTCRMASNLAKFTYGTLVPAARAELGAEIAAIDHLGSYNCRPMRGTNNLLSEHAYANAIDISGFRLADGRKLTVAGDWRGDDASRRFLHWIAPRACRHFTAVLTPNHDARHRDHFHFDNGPLPRCGY